MITLKSIQTPFIITNHAFFNNTLRLPNTRNSILILCKSNGSNSESSPPPKGDTQKQEILARIAMIQAQKVRLTDYLDEKSAHLTQFAEGANVEFDKIGEEALRGLDEASARIMENIEGRMQAFEESAELNKQEIEKSKNELAAFEGQIENERNEGLFFKNLRQRAPQDKAKAKEETEKIKELTIANVGSRTRRNIYVALIGLIVIVIADSFISSSSDWRKVAFLGAILVALISQFAYEQRVSSQTEKTEKKEVNEEKN